MANKEWEYRQTGLLVDSDKQEKLQEYLNEVGAAGWEVCSTTQDHVPSGEATLWGFVLKREKIPPDPRAGLCYKCDNIATSMAMKADGSMVNQCPAHGSPEFNPMMVR